MNQLSKKLLIMVFIMGLVGGAIGYALTTYVSKIYIEIAQPAAEVRTYEVRLSAAPYQTIAIDFAWYRVADIKQYSDSVRYTVSVEAENLQNWKVCLSSVNLKTCLAEANTAAAFTVNIRDTFMGSFSIYVTSVYGKTTNTSAVITVSISFEPIP